MSHIAKVDLQIKDIGAMRAACREMGWKFNEGAQTYRWYGRFMNDTPLPDGMKVSDLGKCEHSISVPGCSYEVGIVKSKTSKGYELRWDYYSGDALVRKLGGQDAPRLKHAYSKALLMKQARLQGLKVVSQKKQKDGSLQMTFAKP